MVSLTNALSSLIPGLDSDPLIGVNFHPTLEQSIRIVDRKNAGGEVLPIFEVDDLFRRLPEQLEEGYYFTKLELVGKNKVNRKLRGGSDRCHWKNINKVKEVVVNNIVIGWVTKLVLHLDKNTPTEWHILEYRDRKTPDPRRWVLCRIYKRENNNGSESLNQDQIQHLTGEHMSQDQIPVVGQYGHLPPGDVVNNPCQFYPSTSQDSSMWASGVRGDMSYPGEHMNQDQIPGVDQYGYPPPGDVVNNPRQFYPSTSQDSSMWASGARGDMSYPGEHMNQDQIPGVGQYGYPSPGDAVYTPQQFTSNNTYGGIDTFSGFDPDDWNGYL